MLGAVHWFISNGVITRSVPWEAPAMQELSVCAHVRHPLAMLANCLSFDVRQVGLLYTLRRKDLNDRTLKFLIVAIFQAHEVDAWFSQMLPGEYISRLRIQRGLSTECQLMLLCHHWCFCWMLFVHHIDAGRPDWSSLAHFGRCRPYSTMNSLSYWTIFVLAHSGWCYHRNPEPLAWFAGISSGWPVRPIEVGRRERRLAATGILACY